jgi:hypothetical protein
MTVSHDHIDWWKKNMSSTNDIYKREDWDGCLTASTEFVSNKRIFASGSQRDDDSNKPLTTALTAYARLRYGYHLRKGSNNYGKDNWKLGQPSEALLESLDRHLAQYLSGDRSEDHLSAIMFGVVMLMQNEEKEGIPVDNYFTKV